MEIGKYINHTNLAMDATASDIEKLCHEAISYGFESVCVHPCYVTLAKELLEDSNINVGTVVGFPLGMSTPKTKSFEAVEAIEMGADEIDMVINIGALKDKDYDYVKKEIEEVRDVLEGKTLSVIIETNLLTDEEIIRMTKICNETFVNFIKTLTGFQSDELSVHDIELIRANKSDVLEIKASGDIKTFEQMNELINAGASKIDTSYGVSIVNESLE